MHSRALVVHATDLLAKGYVAIAPDRTDRDGRPTNALLAVVRGIRQALKLKEPAVAVAVVGPVEGPADLRAQAERLEPLLRAHGLAVVPGDIDTVGSYVQAALAEHDVVVVGGDKRLAQLVSDDVWWVEPFKRVRYTPDSVRKRFEVAPAKTAGWLALVGDDDSLRGVKGIGRKGAAGLIAAHGSVAAALEDPESVEVRAGKALRRDLDGAREQLAIATLDRTRPLPVPWEDLAWTAPDVDTLNAAYGDLGFFGLLQAEAVDREVRLCRTDAEVEAALASLPDAPVSIHATIEDPSPPRGRLVGLAIAGAAGKAFYVPIGDSVSPALAAWLASEAPKIGHDTKQVVTAFARRGVTVGGIVGDSNLGSHLVQPSNYWPHELEKLARLRLQRPLPTPESIRGKGKRQKPWSGVELDELAPYACELADVAGELWRSLEPEVPRPQLDAALDLCRTLVRMELHGMLVDRAELEQAGRDWDTAVERLAAEVHALVGHEFNLGSTKQLGQVLFEELGLTVLSRTKTGFSTATRVLERIAHEHAVVPKVIRWRSLKRLRDSWVTALLASLDDDDRVRSTFHPARSFTGRLVNSDPDLGRVPGRTETMARIRRAFVAPPGSVLMSIDYQQLGLYVLAHLTDDPALVEPLRRGDDMHTLTAAAVLDKAPEDVTYDDRQVGKVVNFATFAGQGASALGMQLGIPAQEARDMIARFDRRYHVTRAYQDEQLRLARERGYLVTISGRHWPIGDLDSRDTQVLQYAERLARRSTHEGSVADVSRRGLLDADHALREAGLDAQPLLQIHDEVVFEVRAGQLDEAARVAADAMRQAWQLRVPLRVGVASGPNWADMEELPQE